MLAGLPHAEVKLPPSLQAVVAGRSVTPVWENELGGLTFEVGAGRERYFYWNYGPGWDNCLLTAYGVGPDPGRMLYYRLLWDLGP